MAKTESDREVALFHWVTDTLNRFNIGDPIANSKKAYSSSKVFCNKPLYENRFLREDWFKCFMAQVLGEGGKMVFDVLKWDFPAAYEPKSEHLSVYHIEPYTATLPLETKKTLPRYSHWRVKSKRGVIWQLTWESADSVELISEKNIIANVRKEYLFKRMELVNVCK